MRTYFTEPDVSCYLGGNYPLEAKDALTRLQGRIPLLLQLASTGVVSEAVWEKIRPSIEADLRTLTSPEKLRELDPETRSVAVKIRQDGEAALTEIQNVMEKKK